MRSLTAILMVGCSHLLAAEPAQKELAPLGIETLVQTAGGLLMILLLIFAGAWLYKRYAQLPTSAKGIIRILGGVSVGPRERVVVLEVGSTHLVVGVAPGLVQTLQIINPQDVDASFASHMTEVNMKQAARSLL